MPLRSFRVRFGLLALFIALGVSGIALAYIADGLQRARVTEQLRQNSFFVQFSDQAIREGDSAAQALARMNKAPTIGRDLFIPVMAITELPADVGPLKIEERGRILRKIDRFVELESLELTQTPIDEEILSSLCRLPKLHTLRVGEETPSDVIEKLFLRLPGIRNLDLSFSKIANQRSAALLHLQQLEILDLSYCNLGTLTCENIARLPNLRELSMVGCSGLDDSSWRAIAKSSTLQSLFVAGNELSNDNLRWLARIKSLRELDVSGNVEITEQGIREFQLLRSDVTLFSDYARCKDLSER